MKKGIFILLICFPAILFAQWNNNPSINTKIADTTGMQVQPKVVVNDNGESYISWFSDFGGFQFDVYMQRFDENGNMLWDESGLLISDHPTMSWTTDYDLVLDKSGNAVLITQDLRNGNSNVYAYSISPNGEFLWGNDGIALTNDSSFDPAPKAVVDQEGNIVTMWENEPADTSQFITISFQKLSPDGNLLWNNIQIANDTAQCWMPRMINTEDSCIIIVWIETHKKYDTSGVIGNFGFMHSYAQKLDAAGNLVWNEKVVIDTVNNMPLQPFFPSLASDGNGGLFVSWVAMANDWEHTCYVQHVSADGVVQWDPNGINVSDSTQFERINPHVVSLQENGMVVFWNEVRHRSDTDWENAILGQKISIDGNRQWTTQGKLVDSWYNEFDTSVYLYDVKAVEEDFALFFSHEYVEVIEPDTLFTTDMYVTRIDTDVNPVWTNSKTVFSNHPSWKLDLFVSDLSNNQWVVAWEDNRNDPEHEFQFGIYAQNIFTDGTIGPLGIEDNFSNSVKKLSNYPNPFVSHTNIVCELQKPDMVEISLIDINGKFVKRVFPGQLSAGNHEYNLNTSELNPGFYLIRLTTSTSIAYHKICKSF